MSTEFNYLRNKRRDEMLGTPFTWPTTAYVRLVTTLSTASTPGTEVGAGLGYTPATLLAANMASGGTGIAENNTILSFGTATADWGTVVAMEVWDASSGGNALYWAPLSPSRTITNGSTVTVPVADLTATNS